MPYLHRSKHHAVYVAGVNGALAKHPDLMEKYGRTDIVKVLENTDQFPDDIKTAIRNHGGLTPPPKLLIQLGLRDKITALKRRCQAL